MRKTLDQQIASAKRELAMRERVYRRKVDENKMTMEQALHETDCMKSIIESLHDLKGLRGESLL